MTLEEILPRLESVRQCRRGFQAKCPAHDDHNPSLSISKGEKGILLKCWSGCELGKITLALGIRVTDLFFDKQPAPAKPCTSRPPKLDRHALAYHFELVALDRRLRAERTVEAGKRVQISSLSEVEFDRAVYLMAQAVTDSEWAELFEDVADGLRLKAFSVRDHERRKRVA